MKPKVLHVTQATGGVETSLLLLFRHLDRDHFEYHLACPPGTTLAAEARVLGVTVHEVAMVRSVSPWRDLAGLVALTRLIRRERYAIVHAHSAKGGYLGRLAASLAGGAQRLYHPRAFSYLSQKRPARDVFLLLERLARPMTDLLIATSGSEGERAVAEVGFERDRVRVVPNAVDVEALGQVVPPPAGEAPLVLTVGRLSYQKNPTMFLDVAEAVLRQRPDVRFCWLGAGFAGPLEREVRTAVARRGLEGPVRLVPWLERTATLSMMAGCSVFVLTSLFEGMPNTVLEAMMLGRPVVVTDVDGSRDAVAADETGYIVPLHDHERMAACVLRLLAQPALADAMGAAARRHARAHFDIRHNARMLEDTYAALLGAPPR